MNKRNYLSHLFIYKDKDEWAFYQHGPWQNDCPQYRSYSDKNRLIALVKRKFPRIESFTKPKNKHWFHQYAIFKKSNKNIFLLSEFILELMECGFLYYEILEISNFLRRNSDCSLLELTKKYISKNYFDCPYAYELNFWFTQINTCKKVIIQIN